MSRSKSLTKGQQEWLGHLRSCALSSETMSAYAARNGLVVQAMYQAASDLRKRGAWGDANRARRPQKPAAFVKVSHEARPSGAGTWRARLPNGVVLEGNDTIGADLVKMLSAL